MSKQGSSFEKPMVLTAEQKQALKIEHQVALKQIFDMVDRDGDVCTAVLDSAIPDHSYRSHPSPPPFVWRRPTGL